MAELEDLRCSHCQLALGGDHGATTQLRAQKIDFLAASIVLDMLCEPPQWGSISPEQQTSLLSNDGSHALMAVATANMEYNSMREVAHALDGGKHVGALGVGLRGVAVGSDGVGKFSRRASHGTCAAVDWI